MKRIACCIPFCKRTKKDNGAFDEWICGSHWRAVRAGRRRVYARLKRLARHAGNGDYRKACRACWNTLKREAIERAGL